MDYDLDRLGPTEFEHMIQALAIAELGISVTTFGAGADDGREATFKGRVVAEHDKSLVHWEGYGVVQAKTIRFASDTSKNSSVLVAATESELTKFLPKDDGSQRKPKPDYYILATNARLSPAGEVGGVDLLEKTMRNHEIHLKGSAVWHYEHICRLLDRHDGIRRTFAGFVTPGDILSQLDAMLGGNAPPLGEILKMHAAAQVSARQALKLETSDMSDGNKVELSEIAVDLPALDRDQSDRMVVSTILAAGDRSLRSSLKTDQSYGFVVIGGPGQGKSTLGQIICQAYRVGLLEEVGLPISPKIDRAIEDTRKRLRQMGLEPPRNRRWPVFIDLSAFADALAAKPGTTISEFVAGQLKSQGATVKASQVVSWLANWPWALVLDGLDEVPARDSRIAVVAALNDFIVESRMQDWDVLVVCTTRPQGYQDEFNELDPQKLELRLLTAEEGLQYGKRIVDARFESDPERASGVLKRLQSASRDKHSSRLMRTPLQVSIMEFLLEELEEVPNTRHELFDGYYRAIYSREANKAGHLGKLLKKYSEQVEWVHERVALALQIQSEQRGDANVSISDGEILALFRERLTEQEFTESDINSIAVELDKAVKQRLVLLVPRTDGRISFEVRSLQEYMAARAVAAGATAIVLDRLAFLAPSAYWRNVWLLAVGRVYSQRPHERDGLIERIRQLDTDSPTGAFIGYGARLSIELLDDDFAQSVPAHRRSLLSLALSQLGRWPGPELKRLSVLGRDAIRGSDSVSASIVSDAINSAFESNGRARLGAVAILRDWEKDDGASGKFSRQRLHGDLSWRPANNSVRATRRTATTVQDVFDEVVAKDGALPTEAWKRLRKAFSGLGVKDDVTAAEAVTFSRSDLAVTPNNPLVELLGEEGDVRSLLQIANAVPIGRAPAAILFRRLLVGVDQQLPRGKRLAALM